MKDGGGLKLACKVNGYYINCCMTWVVASAEDHTTLNDSTLMPGLSQSTGSGSNMTFGKGLLSIFVVLSQQAPWRNNPYSYEQKKKLYKLIHNSKYALLYEMYTTLNWGCDKNNILLKYLVAGVGDMLGIYRHKNVQCELKPKCYIKF